MLLDHYHYFDRSVAARLSSVGISAQFSETGNWVHILIVIAVILIILHLLGVV